MTNRDKINALLKSADEALVKSGIVKDGIVEDGYDSSIAAFGPTVVMSGLMPALAFYCATNKSDKRKTDKGKVVDAIAFTLATKYGKSDHKQLFEYCLDTLDKSNEKEVSEKLMADIIDASVAMKIMVRTYKIVESHG